LQSTPARHASTSCAYKSSSGECSAQQHVSDLMALHGPEQHTRVQQSCSRWQHCTVWHDHAVTCHRSHSTGCHHITTISSSCYQPTCSITAANRALHQSGRTTTPPMCFFCIRRLPLPTCLHVAAVPSVLTRRCLDQALRVDCAAGRCCRGPRPTG
jgi:hypothetical protein